MQRIVVASFYFFEAMVTRVFFRCVIEPSMGHRENVSKLLQRNIERIVASKDDDALIRSYISESKDITTEDRLECL